MKFGIDARFLTHPQKGGFKTYTTALVQALLALATDDVYVLYVDRETVDPVDITNRNRVSMHNVSTLLPGIGMPWREQILLPRQAARDRIDMLHSPCLTAPMRRVCASVVTLHDTIFLGRSNPTSEARPGLRKLLMGEYYKQVVRRTIRNADAVITDSESARTNILSQLHVDSDRLTVIHPAPSSSYSSYSPRPETIQKVKLDHRIGKPYILGMGSSDPRKNVPGLIRAYSMLPETVRDHYDLVIVCTHNRTPPGATQEAQARGVKHKVLYLYEVTDTALMDLYAGSSLFAFTSMYEGFGLPLLEAMSCGAPVVAASNSSIPEVVGDAGLLYADGDEVALSRSILLMLSEPEMRLELKQRGYQRSRQYSWKASASATLGVYRDAVECHRRTAK